MILLQIDDIRTVVVFAASLMTISGKADICALISPIKTIRNSQNRNK